MMMISVDIKACFHVGNATKTRRHYTLSHSLNTLYARRRLCMTSPTVVAVGGIFIDDIVYPDGRTSMEILGGGGVHAAAGMTVWDEHPGLVATMGTDFPPALLTRLNRDFDIQGVMTVPHPQMRAWQLFEWNGKRTEIFRVDVIAPFMDDPQPADMPLSYRDAKGVHVLRSGEAFHGFKQLFSPQTIILWEPEQMYMVAENHDEFVSTLPHTDIVSPNLLEASLVYGFSDPHQLIDAMLNDGANIVALRMGERGSLVASREVRVEIPPVPVPTIVDQTGAGNTYAGAFLVGWRRTRDLRLAAYHAAVAASFALEEVGVLSPPDRGVRDERLAWLQSQVNEK
jgi:cytidine kinase